MPSGRVLPGLVRVPPASTAASSVGSQLASGSAPAPCSLSKGTIWHAAQEKHQSSTAILLGVGSAVTFPYGWSYERWCLLKKNKKRKGGIVVWAATTGRCVCLSSRGSIPPASSFHGGAALSAMWRVCANRGGEPETMTAIIQSEFQCHRLHIYVLCPLFSH